MDPFKITVGAGGLASCVLLMVMSLRAFRERDEGGGAIMCWGAAMTGSLGGFALLMAAT